MSLCLTILSYHKITPGQCAEKFLNEGTIRIGRGPANDWVLPDPERLISSQHCVVQYRDGHYYLTDNSTNGVELVRAGLRMRRGSSERLVDGETFRIGDYEIQARIDSSFQLGAGDAGRGADAQSFEALMGQASAAPAPFATDAFASEVAPAFVPGAGTEDTLADLFDFLSPPPMAPVTQADHLPAQQHDFRPPEVRVQAPAVVSEPVQAPGAAQPLIPADWDLFADIAPAPTPVSAPLPAVESAPAPTLEPTPAPVIVAPPAPHAEPVATPVAAAESADLLQAFLRGAGLERVQVDREQALAQMEGIGRSYRLMVEGLIDVLRARSSLKGEFRMQQTMIRPLENNPLKFAPNADEALMLLLRHGSHAFMAPEQAVRDSFDDLRAHQMAVMAGVEAAIKHLLARFEPGQLEARMASPNGLSKLFAGSRQSQQWQQFTELYSQISREAQDDFHDLFGREFSRAYEAHSARLQRA